MRTVAVIVTSFLVACDRPTAPTDLPGTYRTTYSGFTDVLQIYPDGVFRHIVRSPDQTILDERGQWQWQGEVFRDAANRVEFAEFTIAVPRLEFHGTWLARVHKRFGRTRLV